MIFLGAGPSQSFCRGGRDMSLVYSHLGRHPQTIYILISPVTRPLLDLIDFYNPSVKKS